MVMFSIYHHKLAALALRENAIEARELYLDATHDQISRGVDFADIKHTAAQRAPRGITRSTIGRHRAGRIGGGRDHEIARPFVVPPPPRLVNATVTEAKALLSQARARAEQERREFVDLLTHHWGMT
jgi:hypothetical protein